MTGPGRLEHERLSRAEPQHRATRRGTRERRRLVVTDDVARVGGVLQPKGQAEVGVGADVVADDAGRALGGQHEVDAEAATALGDADERRDEGRQVGGQGGELVDDHDEARQRRPGRHGAVRREVVRAGGAQQPLAAADLGVEADSARSARWSSRSVTRPTVCGSSAQASNVEPPL